MSKLFKDAKLRKPKRAELRVFVVKCSFCSFEQQTLNPDAVICANNDCKKTFKAIDKKEVPCNNGVKQ
jgi:hypothetical protein